MTDIRAVRRAAIGWLRYQYARNLSSPGFTGTVERLLQGSPAAAELWSRHELAFAPHLYPVSIRRPGTGGIVGRPFLHARDTPSLDLHHDHAPGYLSRSDPVRCRPCPHRLYGGTGCGEREHRRRSAAGFAVTAG